MTKSKFLLTLLALLCLGANSQVVSHQMPSLVAGVKDVTLSLNGEWEFQFSKDGNWNPVKVPGELAMQGYAIQHDTPYLYRKQFTVPSSFKGKTVILRFDGVYSKAKLWVNDTYIREHTGGFTRWECNVTDQIKPGKSNEIRLEITDPIDDISYASGYAHHPIGGILRSVTLFALPSKHLTDLVMQTKMDDKYKDAQLILTFNSTAGQKAVLTITDNDGKEVEKRKIEIIQGANTHTVAMQEPEKWDAEHPNLYKVKISTNDYSFDRMIGFRDIKIEGNRMLVNGQQVKLRGACRHDVHPTLGRTTTRELDSLDVELFKQSNMNFVRTSHYPPTEEFLEFCDRAGLYVECETAICFVDTHRQRNYAPAASQNDAAYTDRYMNQMQEMVASLRNHSSVLFWSIGNECVFGSNFKKTYDWVKSADTTRPAIFSYPGTVGKDVQGYDIVSMHYPGVTGTLNQYGASTTGFQTGSKPSIFDEWAHVPCYTFSTLAEDPNIREFWGQSLDMMWSNLFEAQGGLGGAIWGYSDEVFMLPDPKMGSAWWTDFTRTQKPSHLRGRAIGYGEWGIVDVHRREKPEFWSTKKAYSPIRLLETKVHEFTTGQPLMLPIYNRFDHTNLDETNVRYTYKDKQWTVAAPSIDPHKKGLLVVAAQEWSDESELQIEFLDNRKMLIDAYTIRIGSMPSLSKASNNASGKLTIEENNNTLTVRGENFSIPFSLQDGLIHNATHNNQIIIERGPLLNLDLNTNHLTGAEVRQKASNYIVEPADWIKESFSHRATDEKVSIEIRGKYKAIGVIITMDITADGRIEFNYQTSNEPNGWLREAGLRFDLPSTIDSLSWVRQGYWSHYPANSFAGNKGSVALYNTKNEYRQAPTQEWSMDTHNYFYFADRGANSDRPLTYAAKGMKENLYRYELQSDKTTLTVLSESGSLGARINRNSDEQLVLYVNNRWDYPEIAWGDYCKTLAVTPCFGHIVIELNGSEAKSAK